MSIILYHNKTKTLILTGTFKVHNLLYYQHCRVPNEKQISEYMKNGQDKEIKEYFSEYGAKNGIKRIKKDISVIDKKIPLYDEHTKNLYLIDRMNVYDRVTYRTFRFPNEEMISSFKDRKTDLEKELSINKEKKMDVNNIKLGENVTEDKNGYNNPQEHRKILLKREYRKLLLMLDFLDQFDINILQDTYVRVFYYYSNKVGRNITICRRPSFLPHFAHITPYYSRSELINMGLNMGLINPDDKFEDEQISELCQLVKDNDISAETILNHQMYIVKENKVGIIEYYTLQGSYFINQYMRNMYMCNYENKMVEEQVKSIWTLINDAPSFDKSYILYRFIKSDDHLQHLKVGDKYSTMGFLSTTRDPFYKSEIYQYGAILIKVKIPANVKGIALCIENTSHFPEEQEIIMAPGSILELKNKDSDVPYYHTDDSRQASVMVKYEFEFVEKTPIQLEKKLVSEDVKNTKPINFLFLEKSQTFTIAEKINMFFYTNVNSNNQFITEIGGKNYNIIVEWYDSTEAYRNFYATKTSNGFLMYTLIENYLGFTVEIGEDLGIYYIYANYYFRHSTFPIRNKIKDIDLIEFIAKLGYYFGISKAIIYSEYKSCDFTRKLEDTSYYGGNYCCDFYSYLKYGKKKYSDSDIDNIELHPKYSFYELDRLAKIKPTKILFKEDSDELYQIYDEIYKPFVAKNQKNLKDFYIWIIENYCSHTKLLVEKMKNIIYANTESPFDNDYYILNIYTYLYNRNIISSVDEYLEDEGPSYPKNKYRVEVARTRSNFSMSSTQASNRC